LRSFLGFPLLSHFHAVLKRVQPLLIIIKACQVLINNQTAHSARNLLAACFYSICITRCAISTAAEGRGSLWNQCVSTDEILADSLGCTEITAAKTSFVLTCLSRRLFDISRCVARRQLFIHGILNVFLDQIEVQAHLLELQSQILLHLNGLLTQVAEFIHVFCLRFLEKLDPLVLLRFNQSDVVDLLNDMQPQLLNRIILSIDHVALLPCRLCIFTLFLFLARNKCRQFSLLIFYLCLEVAHNVGFRLLNTFVDHRLGFRAQLSQTLHLLFLQLRLFLLYSDLTIPHSLVKRGMRMLNPLGQNGKLFTFANQSGQTAMSFD